MDDAKWRDEQRDGNVKRYRDEDKSREDQDKSKTQGAFLT